MNVAEVARQAGIAPSAVRFYERKGILPAAPRGPNGYREYDDQGLDRLRCIAGLRRLRLDLAEAGRLAGLCASGQCEEMSRDLLSLLAAQRASIVQCRAELDALDRQLAAVETALADPSQDGDVCLKGGDDDDPARLLPVSVPVPLSMPMLTR